MHPVPLPDRHVVPIPRARQPVLVRDATAVDTVSTARLHVRHMTLGLFPYLGPSFVDRWHRAHVQSPHGVALVAVETDPAGVEHITGFVIGSTDRVAFRAELLTRHRRALLLHGVRALVLRPRVLRYFLRTRVGAYLRRLRHSRPTVSIPPGAARPAPIADLTAIAVARERRRTGTGAALTARFLDHCRNSGASRVELVTATQPTGPVEFYTRSGWTAQRRAPSRDGRELQRFVWWFDRVEGDG